MPWDCISEVGHAVITLPNFSGRKEQEILFQSTARWGSPPPHLRTGVKPVKKLFTESAPHSFVITAPAFQTCHVIVSLNQVEVHDAQVHVSHPGILLVFGICRQERVDELTKI